MSDLLSCPFCGDIASLEKTATDGSVWCIGCEAKIVRPHSRYSDHDGLMVAIRVWNTRALPAVQPDAAEYERKVAQMKADFPNGI